MGDSTPLPRYRSHKEVCALKIARTNWTDGGRKLEIVPEDKGFSPFIPSENFTRRNVGNYLPGGYYVRYADGYESFSPAKAFEEGYTRIE